MLSFQISLWVVLRDLLVVLWVAILVLAAALMHAHVMHLAPSQILIAVLLLQLLFWLGGSTLVISSTLPMTMTWASWSDLAHEGGHTVLLASVFALSLWGSCLWLRKRPHAIVVDPSILMGGLLGLALLVMGAGDYAYQLSLEPGFPMHPAQTQSFLWPIVAALNLACVAWFDVALTYWTVQRTGMLRGRLSAALAMQGCSAALAPWLGTLFAPATSPSWSLHTDASRVRIRIVLLMVLYGLLLFVPQWDTFLITTHLDQVALFLLIAKIIWDTARFVIAQDKRYTSLLWVLLTAVSVIYAGVFLGSVVMVCSQKVIQKIQRT